MKDSHDAQLERVLQETGPQPKRTGAEKERDAIEEAKLEEARAGDDELFSLLEQRMKTFPYGRFNSASKMEGQRMRKQFVATITELYMKIAKLDGKKANKIWNDNVRQPYGPR